MKRWPWYLSVQNLEHVIIIFHLCSLELPHSMHLLSSKIPTQKEKACCILKISSVWGSLIWLSQHHVMIQIGKMALSKYCKKYNLTVKCELFLIGYSSSTFPIYLTEQVIIQKRIQLGHCSNLLGACNMWPTRLENWLSPFAVEVQRILIPS